MAVITTPGATQNAYATLAEFKAYCDDRGLVYSSYTDAQIEQAIVRTARWLDGYMANMLPGIRGDATYALLWPRTGAVDQDGYELSGVPLQVNYANIEAAFYDLGAPNTLQATYTPSQQKILTQAGAIKWTPVAGSGTSSARIMLPVVEDLLARVLRDKRGYPAALVV